MRAAIASVASLVIAFAGPSLSRVYVWQPSDTTSHLKGIVTFLPPSGPSFKCHVALTAKTGEYHGSGKLQPKVISAKAIGASCGSVVFTGLPWPLAAANATTGTLSNFGWSDAGAGACTGGLVYFTANSVGQWGPYSGNSCWDGVIRSDPVITIQMRQ